MWLKYGVSADNALMSIEDVPSGKTQLTCLYCGGGLTAKKGKVKQHHFAHTDETCYPIAKKQVPTLYYVRLNTYTLVQIRQKTEGRRQKGRRKVAR